MQLIAPFIHAHAFGLESALAHAAHTHATEDVFHNHAASSDLNLHIAVINHQETIDAPQVIGSIFKVSDGVKRDFSLDIDLILIACLLIFVSMVYSRKPFAPTSNATFYQPQPHSPHSPRAPPR